MRLSFSLLWVVKKMPLVKMWIHCSINLRKFTFYSAGKAYVAERNNTFKLQDVERLFQVNKSKRNFTHNIYYLFLQILIVKQLLFSFRINIFSLIYGIKPGLQLML